MRRRADSQKAGQSATAGQSAKQEIARHLPLTSAFILPGSLLGLATTLVLATTLLHSPLFNLKALAAETKPPVWSASWGASPVFAVGKELCNQTVRMVVKVSCGGKLARLRLSNETGKDPVTVSNVHLALPGKDGAIIAGSDHKLTFGGETEAVIPAGAPLLSDPIELDVKPLSRLAVSLYLPRWTGPCVIHPLGRETGYISKAGNFSGADKFEGDSMDARYFLSEIDTADNRPTEATIATFGDSITDGYGATLGANQRWPDLLSDRLNQGEKRYGVVNAAISGNRLLHDLPACLFGPSGLSRFDRDVLSLPGLTHVIVLIGINDIGQSSCFKLEEQKILDTTLIAGYKQLIARAHAKGVKIIGGTLTPYEGTSFEDYYTPQGEITRQAVNKWIRESGEFDAVIDFDKILRDPQNPTRIKAQYDEGDHLHPSDAGYKAMADAIDLTIFQN